MNYCFLGICCMLMLFCQSVFAQQDLQKQTDSLLNTVSNNTKEDTIKLQQYENLYRNYQRLHEYQEAENYINKTILLGKRLNQKLYIGKAYFYLAFQHHMYDRYLPAEENYQKALAEFTIIQDNDWAAGTYQNLSAMYANVLDYTKALEANFMAIDIYTKMDNPIGVASCYVNIASTYTELKQYGSAAQYLEKALKVFLSNKGNEYGTALCYVKLGRIYFEADGQELKGMGVAGTEKYDRALWYLQQAESIEADLFDLNGEINTVRADIYRKTNQKSLAYQAYNKAMQNLSGSSSKFVYASLLLSFANFYLDEREYSKAMPLLTEALEIGEQNYIPGLQRDVYLALSVMSEKQGRYNDALKYHKEHIAFKEQVFNEEKEKEITRQQLQLDFTIKEKEYQTQQIFQQKLTLLLVGLIFILLAAALIVYKAQRKTARLNRLALAQKEELEKMSRVKDKIFSVVSHDMRTPVNSLLSFIQLLEMGNLSPEKLKKYADSLKTSLGYTSAMMENLLNWAYSQMEGFKPHIETLSVDETLSNLVTAMQEQAKQKGSNLTYTDHNKATVQADKNMLLLVVRNLLSNALKFTPENGLVEIIVSGPEGNTTITIKDNGVGFTESEVAEFNSAPYGINKTTLGTNNEKGTGIGLSLCTTFVKLMNGTLLLESQPGKGSSFTVAFS